MIRIKARILHEQLCNMTFTQKAKNVRILVSQKTMYDSEKCDYEHSQKMTLMKRLTKVKNVAAVHHLTLTSHFGTFESSWILVLYNIWFYQVPPLENLQDILSTSSILSACHTTFFSITYRSRKDNRITNGRRKLWSTYRLGWNIFFVHTDGKFCLILGWPGSSAVFAWLLKYLYV